MYGRTCSWSCTRFWAQEVSAKEHNLSFWICQNLLYINNDFWWAQWQYLATLYNVQNPSFTGYTRIAVPSRGTLQICSLPLFWIKSYDIHSVCKFCLHTVIAFSFWKRFRGSGLGQSRLLSIKQGRFQHLRRFHHNSSATTMSSNLAFLYSTMFGCFFCFQISIHFRCNS